MFNLASAAFDLFPLPCFLKSFASNFQTFPCLVKFVVVANAFFRTFLASSFSWEIREASKPHVSSSFCPSLFTLLFLDVLFNGLSKAINPFELCLWFIAKKTRLILWKIYKLVWMKIEETPTKMRTRLRTDWFILTADFWLDETFFSRVKKSFRNCDRFYPKISVSMK